MGDEELLKRFVAAFSKLDDMLVLPDNGSLPSELDAGRDDSQWATQKWKPAAWDTNRAALTEIHEALGTSFPPLYEQLLLSYRWLEVNLPGFAALFANPPGPSLAGLLSRITADRAVVKVLLPLGFIPLGHAPDDNYDWVCFDTSRRRRGGECPVVQIEHEAVLCDGRVGDSREIALSFRSFVEAVISKAENAECRRRKR